MLGVFTNVYAPSALLTEDRVGFSMETTTEEPTSLVVQIQNHQRQEKERLGQCQLEARQRHLTLRMTENLSPEQVGELAENARPQCAPLGQQEALTEAAFERSVEE